MTSAFGGNSGTVASSGTYGLKLAAGALAAQSSTFPGRPPDRLDVGRQRGIQGERRPGGGVGELEPERVEHRPGHGEAALRARPAVADVAEERRAEVREVGPD